MKVRSASLIAKSDPPRQLRFDLEAAANDTADPVLAPAPAPAGQRVSKPAGAHKPIAASPIRVISHADLPPYPKELIEQVDGSIAALPAEKLWFTYQDVRRSFGVSRATIARRMKEGLVPGLRFRGGRMLEDGAVRRLDREQLRWLLLSLQRSARPPIGRRSAPAIE